MDDGTRGADWFENLFRAHANQIAAYARRRGIGDPDDVVSDVFTAAWRRRQTLPDDALPWLYRTAANVALHAHRGAGRRRGLVARVGAADPPDRDPPDHAAEAAERIDGRRLVERLLAVLPARDAEILRLWAWEQLEADAIAFVLEISPAAARVRLHRARRRAAVLIAHDPAQDTAGVTAQAPARTTEPTTRPSPELP